MVFKMKLLPLLGLLLEVLATNATAESTKSTYSLHLHKKPYGKLMDFSFEIKDIVQAEKEICKQNNHTYECCFKIKAKKGRNVQKTGCIMYQFSPEDENVTLDVTQTTGSVFLKPKHCDVNNIMEHSMNPFGKKVIFLFGITKTLPDEPPQICHSRKRTIKCCFSITSPEFHLYKKGGCLKFRFPRKEGNGIDIKMQWRGDSLKGNHESGKMHNNFSNLFQGTEMLTRNNVTSEVVNHWKVQDGIIRGFKRYPGAPFWSQSRPCSCKRSACYCCTRTLLPLPENPHHSICMIFTFQEKALNLEITLKGEFIYGGLSKVDNPNKVCVTPIRTPLERICVSLMQSFRVGSIIYGCVEVNVFFNHIPVFHEALGCIRVGSNGLAEALYDEVYDEKEMDKGYYDEGDVDKDHRHDEERPKILTRVKRV